LTQKSPKFSSTPKSSSSKLNTQTTQRRNFPRIKSQSSVNASILNKIGVMSPPLAKLKNLQIEIPNSFHNIQTRNLITKEDISPNNLLSMDSPIGFQKNLNKRTQSQQKLPPMLNLQDVSKFQPRFIVQGPSAKRPSILIQREESPTKIEGRASRRTIQNANHSYESPTLSSLKRKSLRAQRDSISKRFDFSKPREPGYSPGLKYLNEPGKSPTLLSSASKQQSPSPPSSKLEVCGKNIESPQRRKSGFFRNKWIKNRNASMEPTPATVKESPSSNKQRRVSGGILTKELEAKYGIKLSNRDETEQSPTDSVKSPLVLSDEISPKTAEKAILISPTKLNQSEQSSNDDDDDHDETSTNDHDEKVISIPLQKISSLEPIDMTNEADKIWNDALRPLRSKSHSKTLDPSCNFLTEEEIKIKGKPIVAIFSSSPQTKIVQPEFMKRTGSMCFTEFWSQKDSKKFMRLVQKNVKSVKIFNNKRQHESVYRPDKWKEEEKIKAKIQTIKHEPHRLSVIDVKTPKGQASMSKSESVKIFAPVTPRSPNSNNMFNTPSGQNVKSPGALFSSAFKSGENFMRKPTGSATKPSTAFSAFSRRTAKAHI